jgi:hypothetical protein
MMKLAIVLTLTLATLTLGTVATSAQGHQGAMGVWILNVQQSKFDPGPLPKVQTSTFTLLPDGTVKIENDSTDAQGRTSHREMTSKFDGRQEERSGSPQPTSRAYRWLDDLNFEFEELINGQRSVIGRTSMSKDGNVRTLTVNGMRSGMPVHNIEVYERQRPGAPAR